MEDEQKITVEEIRKLQQFENLSNEDAEKVIESIYKLTVLAYNISKKNN